MDRQSGSRPEWYELHIADYPIDGEAIRSLLPHLVAGVTQGKAVRFMAGEHGDIPLYAVDVFEADDGIVEIDCYVEGDPDGRLRIDVDRVEGLARVFALLTESQLRAVEAEAALKLHH